MDEVANLQDAHCAAKDREYRRAAGQFFTPRWIANGMARWVTSSEPDQIIDPAFGFGMLLDECLRQGYGGRLTGYEIDPEVTARWRAAHGEHPRINLREADFLETSDEPIAAAIVNPPYNRFQRRDLPGRLQLQLARSLGDLASGYTNQYALFLYLVLSRLARGGRAAFIVPSEFLATGYGVQVKRFLIRNRRLRHLIIFDTATRIFADAMTTACVLLFDGVECNDLEVWHLEGEAEAAGFAAICAEVRSDPPDSRVAYPDLDSALNWQGLGRGECNRSGFVQLREFGDVKRGIATGANEFFVLRPSEARQLGLGQSELVPCIASASSVPEIIFTNSHLENLAALDKPTFLFDGLSLPTDSGKRYLEHGEGMQYHLRYLTRMRRPWYRLESRQAAPLLLAVFGRDGFRVSMNRSTAVNLTAFHGFYPKPGWSHFVALIWFYFQTATGKSGYAGQHRAYGDGLKKLEPGDWSKLHVPDWRQWDAASLSQAQQWATQALDHCANGAPNCPDSILAEFEVLIERNRTLFAPIGLGVGGGQQLALI